nr:hypothetical protein Itr_chr02CG09920 [Ipomoea trifida]
MKVLAAATPSSGMASEGHLILLAVVGKDESEARLELGSNSSGASLDDHTGRRETCSKGRIRGDYISSLTFPLFGDDSFALVEARRAACIAAMDKAILRREEYLRKDVRATFPQAVSPSSEHQEEEKREVCEKDVALEERGGGVEMVCEKDVVVEERVDGV